MVGFPHFLSGHSMPPHLDSCWTPTVRHARDMREEEFKDNNLEELSDRPKRQLLEFSECPKIALMEVRQTSGPIDE